MRKTLFLTLALLACLGLGSCDKNKNKTTDPLQSTVWTAYDNDYLMVLKFELGTVASFYIGDENLNRRNDVAYSPYTLTDNTRLSFSSLNGRMDNERFRFKTGTLDGDSMTVVYDRWTSVSGIDSPKEHKQAVFTKRTATKK